MAVSEERHEHERVSCDPNRHGSHDAAPGERAVVHHRLETEVATGHEKQPRRQQAGIVLEALFDESLRVPDAIDDHEGQEIRAHASGVVAGEEDRDPDGADIDEEDRLGRSRTISDGVFSVTLSVLVSGAGS